MAYRFFFILDEKVATNINEQKKNEALYIYKATSKREVSYQLSTVTTLTLSPITIRK
jgi:hypothetical protein